MKNQFWLKIFFIQSLITLSISLTPDTELWKVFMNCSTQRCSTLQNYNAHNICLLQQYIPNSERSISCESFQKGVQNSISKCTSNTDPNNNILLCEELCLQNQCSSEDEQQQAGFNLVLFFIAVGVVCGIIIVSMMVIKYASYKKKKMLEEQIAMKKIQQEIKVQVQSTNDPLAPPQLQGIPVDLTDQNNNQNPDYENILEGIELSNSNKDNNQNEFPNKSKKKQLRNNNKNYMNPQIGVGTVFEAKEDIQTKDQDLPIAEILIQSAKDLEKENDDKNGMIKRDYFSPYERQEQPIKIRNNTYYKKVQAHMNDPNTQLFDQNIKKTKQKLKNQGTLSPNFFNYSSKPLIQNKNSMRSSNTIFFPQSLSRGGTFASIDYMYDDLSSKAMSSRKYLGFSDKIQNKDKQKKRLTMMKLDELENGIEKQLSQLSEQKEKKKRRKSVDGN